MSHGDHSAFRPGRALPTAGDWDRLIQSDPRAALRAYHDLGLDVGRADATDVVVARMAAARACFELGALEDAGEHVRAAMDRVGAVPATVRAGALLTAAAILTEAGRLEPALEALDRLADESSGIELGRVHLQRAFCLQHAGRLHDALAELDRSERLVRASDDLRDPFRVALMRGVVLLQRGDHDAAEADFLEAARLSDRLGMTVGRAQCETNLGVLHGRARRLQQALDHFAAAADLFAAAGNPRRTVATMEIDRAEVMMHSGLVVDAVDAARRAIDLLAPTGNLVQIADAHLVLLRTLAAAADRRSAERVAQTAVDLFTRTGRADMAALSDAVVADLRLRSVGSASEWEAASASSASVCERLTMAGWQEAADELRHSRIRAARAAGALPQVSDDLAVLRAKSESGHRNEALMGRHAEAVARSADGDLPGALTVVRSGLDVVDQIVAETATLAQRSAAVRVGADLSQLAIDLAVDLGDADTVLAAAEGTRARALHEELQEERPHQRLGDDGAFRLRHELATRLVDRTLIEWIVSGDDVWAVVFDDSGGRLVRVARQRDVARARDRVLVWLDVATTDPDDSSRRALRSTAALDELLLAPLDLPSDGGVVIVPVGPLHGIPWSGLPTFAGRPATVTPTARLWLHADRRADGPVRTVGVVVGPDVAAAALERETITRCHPQAAVAADAAATAAAVRSMFGGHDLVHVAAHGRFRSDRPLLSTLQLHEGERSLGDVVPDRIGARLVVLSSCEGGAHGTADGSEVLGLASVLLARGAATVVAPLTAVRDLECADFVAEVHAELARGEPVACALANVRARWSADDDLSRWAVASSFGCFGSGAATVAI